MGQRIERRTTPILSEEGKRQMTEDTPESVATELAYFEAHADRFAAAHKFVSNIISNAAPIDRSGSKGPGQCAHRISLNEHCPECLEWYRQKGL